MPSTAPLPAPPYPLQPGARRRQRVGVREDFLLTPHLLHRLAAHHAHAVIAPAAIRDLDSVASQYAAVAMDEPVAHDLVDAEARGCWPLHERTLPAYLTDRRALVNPRNVPLARIFLCGYYTHTSQLLCPVSTGFCAEHRLFRQISLARSPAKGGKTAVMDAEQKVGSKRPDIFTQITGFFVAGADAAGMTLAQYLEHLQRRKPRPQQGSADSGPAGEGQGV